jgi:hypothetical protein
VIGPGRVAVRRVDAPVAGSSLPTSVGSMGQTHCSAEAASSLAVNSVARSTITLRGPTTTSFSAAAPRAASSSPPRPGTDVDGDEVDSGELTRTAERPIVQRAVSTLQRPGKCRS